MISAIAEFNCLSFSCINSKLLHLLYSLYSLTPHWSLTRPSRPIRCDVWIVERMRYPTDQPTDTASYSGASSHLKIFFFSQQIGLSKSFFFLTANWYIVDDAPRICGNVSGAGLCPPGYSCYEVTKPDLNYSSALSKPQDGNREPEKGR